MRKVAVITAVAVLVVSILGAIGARANNVKAPSWVRPESTEDWVRSHPPGDTQPTPKELPAAELNRMREALATLAPVRKVLGSQDSLTVILELTTDLEFLESIEKVGEHIWAKFPSTKVLTIISRQDPPTGMVEIHLTRSEFEGIDWKNLSGKTIKEVIPSAIVDKDR